MSWNSHEKLRWFFENEICRRKMLGFRPVRFNTANETSPNQRCTHMAGYLWGAYNRAARRRIPLRSPSGAGLLSWPRALYSSGVMRRAWFGHEISSLLRNLRWTPDVAATTPGGRVRYPNVILRSLFVTNTDAQSTYSSSRFRPPVFGNTEIFTAFLVLVSSHHSRPVKSECPSELKRLL